MCVTVGHIGAPLGQTGAPVGEIDALYFAELHVDTALADACAAHAGKVGLAAHLERKTAVHDVIPAIPFGNARGVHGTDEVAQTLRRGDEDLLSADAVQLGNREVHQAARGAL